MNYWKNIRQPTRTAVGRLHRVATLEVDDLDANQIKFCQSIHRSGTFSMTNCSLHGGCGGSRLPWLQQGTWSQSLFYLHNKVVKPAHHAATSTIKKMQTTNQIPTDLTTVLQFRHSILTNIFRLPESNFMFWPTFQGREADSSPAVHLLSDIS
jgi:hypothetical protein